MQIRRGMKLKEGSGLFVSVYTLYVYIPGVGIKADKGNKSGTVHNSSAVESDHISLLLNKF